MPFLLKKSLATISSWKVRITTPLVDDWIGEANIDSSGPKKVYVLPEPVQYSTVEYMHKKQRDNYMHNKNQVTAAINIECMNK